ncbi:MAG TPA: glycoside hydrolase family 38 C-terminal domain-containing protein [Microbacterium sp.]|uniref:alpha-mannosidase n=1 Tax=Microbacterium sp. TaxID=51671 RepID=UPI002F95D2EF
MHDDRRTVEGRLTRFVRTWLEPATYRAFQPLEITRWVAPGEPVPFATATAQEFSPVEQGAFWGAAWGTTWFRVQGSVPVDWAADDDVAVELLLDLGFTADRPGFQCEGLVYHPDGTILKGLNPLSAYVPWDPARRGAGIDIFIEGASNPDVAGSYDFHPTDLGLKDTAGDVELYSLGRMGVALRDVTIWELRQDIGVLAGLMEQLPLDSPRRHRILRGIERMLDTLDPDAVSSTAGEARAILAPLLADRAVASSHRVTATGHAHIDSAWLWPARETERKCARTFSNAIALLDENPDFVFAASSAQQYAWVKRSQPELFERIKERVTSGRFVPVGGMWVESDTMMPSGESLVRQFVFGKRFFLQEFGVETEEVWLPDSFGYSAALPQIAKAAGNRWLLTQKLSWNRTNPMPHHTFQWEGIDGSRIFTHFPPVDTYISELSPAELLHAERNFRESGVADRSLVPFGWGDGGGGPTREILAAGERARDLDGLPRVSFGSPREFFEAAEADYPDAPSWHGEMYLELHRGIFTSQLRAKQGNRRSEGLLREAELWAATAAVRVNADYPADALRDAWEQVLLLQFHDILPGSSIAWVYSDAAESYARVRESLEGIIRDSLRALAGEGSTPLVANASPSAVGDVAALSVAERPEVLAPVGLVEDGAGGITMDNGLIKARLDPDGSLTSLIGDGGGRNAITPGGSGNRLVLHRDTPNEWDAWDIDEHYRRNAEVLRPAPGSVSWGVREDGVAFVGTRIAFGGSTIVQTHELAPGAVRLDIVYDIEWRERQKLLKLYMDLDVHAERFAAESQFGHVYRPTFVNTSWEAARFEVCAHRWVHVQEPGYGVAVVNDSTYGHSVVTEERAGGGRATVIGLSLVRAPLFPDPEADQGRHRLRVAIVPDATIDDAVDQAYEVTLPPRPLLGDHGVEPLIDVGRGAVIDAVKLAEDGSGDVVVRIHEHRGSRATVELRPRFASTPAVAVDLLERPLSEGECMIEDGRIELRPFQLVTLRFRRTGADHATRPSL